MVDNSNTTIAAIIKGPEVLRTIVKGGSGVNVISQQTCDMLGIKEWQPCPFWLRMANTSSVRPAGLIRYLEVTIRGHTFRISAMVLRLNTHGAYPLLLGRPWLRTAHIKQKWQLNIITIRRGKAKVRLPTQPQAGATKKLTPLYVESIIYQVGWASPRRGRSIPRRTSKDSPIIRSGCCRSSHPIYCVTGRSR